MGKSKEDLIEIEKLYHKLGLKYNINSELIKEIVESPYKFTKEKVINLNFHVLEKEEEFKKLKVNFAFKYLGKFFPTFRKIIQINNHRLRLKNKKL